MKKLIIFFLLIYSISNAKSLYLAYYNIAQKAFIQNNLIKSKHFLIKTIKDNNSYLPAYILLKKICIKQNNFSYFESVLFKYLNKPDNKGFNISYTFFINSQMTSENKIFLKQLNNSLSNLDFFSYIRYKENFYNRNDIIDFHKKLNDYLYYQNKNLNEIISLKILTSILINYNIPKHITNLSELSQFLNKHTYVKKTYYTENKYFKIPKPKSNYSPYKINFTPVTVEINIPYIYPFLKNLTQTKILNILNENKFNTDSFIKISKILNNIEFDFLRNEIIEQIYLKTYSYLLKEKNKYIRIKIINDFLSFIKTKNNKYKYIFSDLKKNEEFR